MLAEYFEKMVLLLCDINIYNLKICSGDDSE